MYVCMYGDVVFAIVVVCLDSFYKIARLEHSLLSAYLTCTGYRNKAITYSNMQILMETSTNVMPSLTFELSIISI